MKLPDFTNDDALNELRRKMGATSLGKFQPIIDNKRLTEVELEKLTSGGLDVSIDDVRILDDGTLAYKDSRVLLYIRDVPVYGSKYGKGKDLPKFHVANCTTLQDMRLKKRWERYVVATREDGQFAINFTENKKVQRSTLEKLNICQNCLNLLSFDNFSFYLSRGVRYEIVRRFTIPRFFEKYPKSFFQDTPKHNSDTAPVNVYPDDFDKRSEEVKNQKGWLCEKCGLPFNTPERKRFLHTHHKNGQKYDSSPDNLAILCIGCHAEEDMHSHIKNDPHYRVFMELIGDEWKRAISKFHYSNS